MNLIDAGKFLGASKTSNQKLSIWIDPANQSIEVHFTY
jgi:hypothetical protein